MSSRRVAAATVIALAGLGALVPAQSASAADCTLLNIVDCVISGIGGGGQPAEQPTDPVLPPPIDETPPTDPVPPIEVPAPVEPVEPAPVDTTAPAPVETVTPAPVEPVTPDVVAPQAPAAGGSANGGVPPAATNAPAFGSPARSSFVNRVTGAEADESQLGTLAVPPSAPPAAVASASPMPQAVEIERSEDADVANTAAVAEPDQQSGLAALIVMIVLVVASGVLIFGRMILDARRRAAEPLPEEAVLDGYRPSDETGGADSLASLSPDLSDEADELDDTDGSGDEDEPDGDETRIAEHDEEIAPTVKAGR